MAARRITLGGAVQADDLYVTRSQEHALLRHADRGGWFQVYGSRTQGKTSLVGHAERVLLPRAGGAWQVLTCDCNGLGEYGSLDEWLERLADDFKTDARGRDLSPPELQGDEAPHRRLAHYLTHWQAPEGARLLFVIDEIDRPVLRFRDALPGVLRSTAALTSAHASRVSVCLVGLRPLHDYGHPDRGDASPVGPQLEMGDFDPNDETVETIATALCRDPDGGDLEHARAATRYLLEQTGGQPLLTMSLAERLKNSDGIGVADAESVVADFIREEREKGQDGLLRSIHRSFLEPCDLDPWQALAAYELLRAGKETDATVGTPATVALQQWGLCRARRGKLEIKGPVFRQCFDGAWIRRMREALETARTAQRAPHVLPRREAAVFVINTGGTLGMVRHADQVVQPRDFAEFAGNFPELESHLAGGEQPFALDSVNVTPEHWEHLARRIRAVRRDNPRLGFVVVHGTDTMAYTASALAFAFGQTLDFPIVFTGSQTTPDVKHGDARANLLRACLVARQPLPEVTIAFGDEVYRAVRARKRDERQFAGFESVGVASLGDLSEHAEIDVSRLRSRLPHDKSVTHVTAWAGAGHRFVCRFAKRVMTIQLVPGLEPDFYEHVVQSGGPTCRGIVIQVLGAGNVTSEGEYGFHELIAQATRADIPVLLTSRFRWRPGFAREYAPAAGAIQVGAIAGGEMTPEAAVAKFRWALAIADQAGRRARSRVEIVQEVMGTNFVGEMDGPLATLAFDDEQEHSEVP